MVDDSPFDLSLVPIDDEPPNDDPVDQSKELTYDHLTSSHHHSQVFIFPFHVSVCMI